MKELEFILLDAKRTPADQRLACENSLCKTRRQVDVEFRETFFRAWQLIFLFVHYTMKILILMEHKSYFNEIYNIT